MYYTKYRPQTFTEISQPNEVSVAIAKQLTTGKTAHAYLFIGSRGTGKTTTARVLAKALNCTNLLKTGDPCCKCPNCIEMQNGSFIDLIEIDAASNRGIDDIRALREKVKLTPVNGLKKIYIIDEVHMLTTEAFNALLKTLEEPPKHAVFILCTTEEHKVPDTIKSRCQVFKFKRATIAQLVTKMELICKAEGIQVVKTEEELAQLKGKEKILLSQLTSIARIARGGFRDAETMLEQAVEGGIKDFFSTATTIGLFTESIITKDTKGALSLLNSLTEQGIDLTSWTSDLLFYLRSLLFTKSGIQQESFDQELAKKQANSLTPARLVEMLETFAEAQSRIKSYPIHELPLEIAVARLCSDFKEEESTKTKQTDKPSPKAKGAPEQVEDNDDEDNGKGISVEFLRTSANKKGEALSDEIQAVDDNLQAENSGVVDEVSHKWEEIVNSASLINNSISALLKSCKPINYDSGELILEVVYKFHKERLENSKNKALVEEVVKAHFSRIKGIRCVLSSVKPETKNKFEVGELTDMNISPVVGTSINNVSPENLVNIFDGGLPM